MLSLSLSNQIKIYSKPDHGYDWNYKNEKHKPQSWATHTSWEFLMNQRGRNDATTIEKKA